jgi:hypothetical protein
VSVVLPFLRPTAENRGELRRVARARARNRETLAMVDAELERIRRVREAPAREIRRRLIRDRILAALLVYTTVFLQIAVAGVPLVLSAVFAAALTLAIAGVLLFIEHRQHGDAP